MDNFKKILRNFGRALYIIFIRWGILILGATFLMWYLQYRVADNSPESAWLFWDQKPMVFWYSALIIFCFVALLYGIFHRPFLAVGITFAIITIITYINNTKMSFRGTPLLPEDFQLSDQAGTLTKFIDMSVLVRVILASILAVGLSILLEYLTNNLLRIPPALPKVPRRKPKTNKARIRRRKLIGFKIAYFTIPRIIIIPLALWGFLASSTAIINHEAGAYQKISWLKGTDFVAWNQTVNYSRNGFLFGFLYNLNKATLEKPKDYNATEIAKIKSSYQKEADKEPNASKTELKNEDYNIIIVLNESYYDSSLIQEDYPFSGADPLPTFRKLMKETPTGYMYSTDYGGGTANIEFEVDTSLSNYWAKTVPYTDILPKIKNIISIAKDAKSAGYKTTAIHSFTGGMYKRDFALKKEGFDTFITETEMKHQERDGNSEYINDQSIYEETLDVLKGSKQKQLISVVTMQNHAPYYRPNYNEEDYHFEFLADDWDENFKNELLAYLESVYRSDLYLGEFLNNLKNLDEKTVVLFYGDHAPGIFSLTRETGDERAIKLTQLTPYFIWANFEMDTESKTLPTTTPNCLVNTLLGVLNLRLNAEQMLVHDACAENPILTPYYLGDKTPSGKATKAYELLNYDILGGDQYWFK